MDLFASKQLCRLPPTSRRGTPHEPSPLLLKVLSVQVPEGGAWVGLTRTNMTLRTQSSGMDLM
jgi:hypothetical protein